MTQTRPVIPFVAELRRLPDETLRAASAQLDASRGPQHDRELFHRTGRPDLLWTIRTASSIQLELLRRRFEGDHRQ